MKFWLEKDIFGPKSKGRLKKKDLAQNRKIRHEKDVSAQLRKFELKKEFLTQKKVLAKQK